MEICCRIHVGNPDPRNGSLHRGPQPRSQSRSPSLRLRSGICSLVQRRSLPRSDRLHRSRRTSRRAPRRPRFWCLYLWTHLQIFSALTYASAWLNLFNMIPVFNFDGAQATYALDRLQRGLLLAACLILFALMHEAVFLFIGAGMIYRLFTRDVPEKGSPATLAGYLGMLFALGAVLYFVPNSGVLVR